MAEEQAQLDLPSTGEQAEAPAPVNPEVSELKAKLETLEKRYSDSSTEAKRLHERAVKAETLLQEKDSSLKQDRVQEFPSRDASTKYLTEQHEFTDKQAAFLYERDKAMFEQNVALRQQNIALANLIKHKTAQFEKGFGALDPVAEEASKFFEGIPELEGLSPVDKVERYKALTAKNGIKIVGRDTRSAKEAAGGSVGGKAASTVQMVEMDGAAKELGWPPNALKDFANVTTSEEMDSFKRKYPNIKL